MPKTTPNPRKSSLGTLLMALVLPAAVACSGCVQRRMTIRSNPPGAQVYVDNHEIGRTPVSTDFIYYGKRKIRLVKDGYETLTVEQPVRPPWYQIPGIDFFAENLTPWEVRDERQFDFQMQPLLVVPSETLLARGEELRRSNQLVPAGVPGAVTQPTVAQPNVGLPGTGLPSPYAVPPSVVAPGSPPATPVPTLPPAASTNYPPSSAPPTFEPNPSPAPYSPTEYGGRPVAPLP